MTNFYFFHLLIKIKTFEKNHIDFYIFEKFVKKMFFCATFFLIMCQIKQRKNYFSEISKIILGGHYETNYSNFFRH